jgi:protein-tyrosine phosphatase
MSAGSSADSSPVGAVGGSGDIARSYAENAVKSVLQRRSQQRHASRSPHTMAMVVAPPLLMTTTRAIDSMSPMDPNSLQGSFGNPATATGGAGDTQWSPQSAPGDAGNPLIEDLCDRSPHTLRGGGGGAGGGGESPGENALSTHSSSASCFAFLRNRQRVFSGHFGGSVADASAGGIPAGATHLFAPHREFRSHSLTSSVTSGAPGGLQLDDLGVSRSLSLANSRRPSGLPAALTPIVDEVLYLGSHRDVCDAQVIHSYGIRAFLCVASEVSAPLPPFVTEADIASGAVAFKHVKLQDGPSTQLIDHVEEVFRFIDEQASEGRPVALYCQQGKSRSPAFAVAYLMRELEMGPMDALELLQSMYPRAEPNFFFISQLQELATHHLPTRPWGRAPPPSGMVTARPATGSDIPVLPMSADAVTATAAGESSAMTLPTPTVVHFSPPRAPSTKHSSSTAASSSSPPLSPQSRADGLEDDEDEARQAPADARSATVPSTPNTFCDAAPLPHTS